MQTMCGSKKPAKSENMKKLIMLGNRKHVVLWECDELTVLIFSYKSQFQNRKEHAEKMGDLGS